MLLTTTLPRTVAAGTFLCFSGSIRNADGPYLLGGVHSVGISPDDAHLYAVSFDDDAVVVLDRNSTDGTLTFVEAQVNGMNGVQGLLTPAAVAVSPDGANVYVASFFGDSLATFQRDATSGQLSFVDTLFGGEGGITGLTQLDAVAVSPDGANVYAASFGDNAVAVLHRDATSGALTFMDALIDGTGTVAGLFRASGIAVSPDGSHVYASASGSSAVSGFSRDVTSGMLTFVEALVDATDGVSGLSGAIAVTVSPDGAHVYGLGDSGLAVFRRDVASGRLTFLGAQTDGVANARGTSSPSAVAVSPDGATVYVTRAGDDTLSALQRHPGGTLSILDEATNNQDGVTGLAGANAVAVSSDSKFAYVAAPFADAVTAFRVNGNLCAGDCDGDNEVTVDEVVRGVNIALGTLSLSLCSAFDTDSNGMVTIDELIAAVNNALNGCPQ